jgi:hypothetical protein
MTPDAGKRWRASTVTTEAPADWTAEASEEDNACKSEFGTMNSP